MVRNSSLPISMRQVTKKYGNVFALDHVDLDIRSGEFLTLLGPSGSGKTTLLTVLAGFTRPDHGSLKFGDAEMITTPPHKRGVGMVFQNYALFPHMSVAENVAFALRLRGVARSESAERVEKALNMVRLAGFGARGIDQLSGGQRQRVALARAMVFEPRIMLMDEPLSALDKQLREHMQIELRQLHDKLGMTTVYVTHDQREALTMSDRIAVVNGGRIVQLDTPRAIYERPAHRFVAEFIGESTFVPVTVVQGQVRLAERALRAAEHPGVDGARLLMLRPERLQLLDAGQAEAADGLNVFGGRLVAQVYQGDSALLHVALDDGTMVWLRHATHGTGKSAPEPGAPVRLGLSPQDTVLLPAEGSAA
ncbi:ABC transporter ATP-binding protein [Variovorax sp. M-6]|uniref:ABC transporter ATP-binding protein n=1 Tax=Variovorax sp. M-6 TaxID=3233041 RepID=UPI003F9E9C4C